MELLKMLSASEILAQIVSFFLLLFLLRVFAWGKILKFLDQRKERIASELKGIEEAKKDVSKLKDDYSFLLSNIEEKASLKMKEVLKSGEAHAQEIIKKAELESERILEDTKKEVKYEINKSKDELKKKIVELTISVTEDMIQEKITSQEDRRLIEEFLQKVDKMEEF